LVRQERRVESREPEKQCNAARSGSRLLTLGSQSPRSMLMSIGLEPDVKQIVVSTSAFGPREIEQITAAVADNYSRYRDLRDAVAELEAQPNRSPAMSARLGVCYYLLGRYSEAVETLAHSDGGALTHFYLGKAYLALDKYEDALTAYQSAERAGYA